MMNNGAKEVDGRNRDDDNDNGGEDEQQYNYFVESLMRSCEQEIIEPIEGIVEGNFIHFLLIHLHLHLVKNLKNIMKYF